MSYRYHSSHILSLLHFNYPYYSETGDGLTDDIATFSWSRTGSAKLVGSQAPADSIVTGTPKFGYRCLQTDSNSDCITGTSFSALTLPQVECSMWVRLTASGTGNILQLKHNDSTIITLAVNSENKLVVASSSLGLNFTSSDSLTLNTWMYVRLHLATHEVGVSINNGSDASASMSGTRETFPSFNTITLGGIHGQIDEFTLRDTFTSTLPSAPTQATCNVNSLGGFGTGSLGNVTLNANCVMNTCGCFVKLPTGYSITNVRTGKFGSFKIGDEIMLLNMATGEYCFRTITDISASTVKLNNTVSTAFENGNTQAIQVPHFNTLTVGQGIVITPNAWDSMSGGIVAFRCKGNCTINGQVITSGYGRTRTDLLQMTHSRLIDNFITNTGGGIFITCGGVFSAGESARLGATWSGAGEGGGYTYKRSAGSGGAGYGGGGTVSVMDYDFDANYNGGVGYGGAGFAGTVGVDRNPIPKGIQGQSEGGNASIGTQQTGTLGGGGAGGNGGSGVNPSSNYTSAGGYSGANVILITKTLSADAAAISTGGQGGKGSTNITGFSSGGGTGFCYIACERMI